MRTIIVLLCIALSLLAATSFWQLSAAQAALNLEQHDAQVCRTLADEITSLRNLPQFAVIEAESVETIFGHIQSAADAVPLPQNALVRIQPSAPVYLGDTAYRSRPIRLELQVVTMKQVVTFAHHLVDERGGFTVRDLEVWQDGARQTAQGETWNAELTLTQLVFSPMRRQLSTPN